MPGTMRQTFDRCFASELLKFCYYHSFLHPSPFSSYEKNQRRLLRSIDRNRATITCIVTSTITCYLTVAITSQTNNQSSFDPALVYAATVNHHIVSSCLDIVISCLENLVSVALFIAGRILLPICLIVPITILSARIINYLTWYEVRPFRFESYCYTEEDDLDWIEFGEGFFHEVVHMLLWQGLKWLPPYGSLHLPMFCDFSAMFSWYGQRSDWGGFSPYQCTSIGSCFHDNGADRTFIKQYCAMCLELRVRQSFKFYEQDYATWDKICTDRYRLYFTFLEVVNHTIFEGHEYCTQYLPFQWKLEKYDRTPIPSTHSDENEDSIQDNPQY